MGGQNLDWQVGGRNVDELQRAMDRPAVLAGSAFALGVVTGLFLKSAVTQMRNRARGTQWQSEYERTVEYDGNLPDPLGRREPHPESGEPRYGGTGALGVPPTSVDTRRS